LPLQWLAPLTKQAHAATGKMPKGNPKQIVSRWNHPLLSCSVKDLKILSSFMNLIAKTLLQTSTPAVITTSCGTIIVNPEGKILLCHATGTSFWDIPKGRRE
jgi:hypothetical protein